MILRRILLPVAVYLSVALAWGSDQSYLRDPNGGPSCQITNVTNTSPPTVTCAFDPVNFSDRSGRETVIIIYHVRGAWGVNGIRKVATGSINHASKSFQIVACDRVDCSITKTLAPPGLYTGDLKCSYCPPHSTASFHAYADPAKLYMLKDHPRGTLGLDGPNGKGTASLSSRDRATPSNPAYAAMNTAYEKGIGTCTATADGSLAIWANAAVKWFADGQKIAAALNCAKVYIDNPDLVTFFGSFCDESPNSRCGRDLVSFTDTVMNHIEVASLIYELTYYKLTSEQRQKFADYFLNDLANSSDGLGIKSDPSTSCSKITLNDSPRGSLFTIDNTGMQVTAVNGDFGQPGGPQVGDVFYVDPQVASGHSLITDISDARHLTLYDTKLKGKSGSWKWAHRWNDAISPPNCGLFWMQNHHGAGPLTDEVNYIGALPTVSTPSNMTYTKAHGKLMMGLSLCGQDPRGCTLAAEASAYWWDTLLSSAAGNWGYLPSGTGYNMVRTGRYAAGIPLMLRGAIASPGYIDLSFDYIADFLMTYVYLTLPYGPPKFNIMQYGEAGDSTYNAHGEELLSLTTGLQLLSGTEFAKYAASWLKNNSGFSFSLARPSAKAEHYVLYDADQPMSDISKLPKQYFFHARSSAMCGTYQLMCSSYPWPMHAAVSRTGFGPSDTVIHITSLAYVGYGDHGSANWCGGCLRIYKGAPLLAGDHIHRSGSGNGNNGSIGAADNEYDDQIEVGADERNWRSAGTFCNTLTATPQIMRWAHRGSGALEFGDSTSDFAYLLDDLTSDYCPELKIARALKHIVHFKKSETQDFIVRYFDAATSSGTTQFREFLHFRVMDDDGNLYTCAAGSGTQCVNVPANNQIVLLTDNRDARLNEEIIPTSATDRIYFSRPKSNFPGAKGSTVRAEVGSSNDGVTLGAVAKTEWAIVDMPCKGVTCTMPNIVEDAAATHRIIEIQGSSPKVAALPIDGTTYAGIKFTSTHSGVAQYLIAGLSAGTYSVSVNGSTLRGSPFSVSEGDNTLYFESAAGNISVTQSPGLPGSK